MKLKVTKGGLFCWEINTKKGIAYFTPFKKMVKPGAVKDVKWKLTCEEIKPKAS